MNNIRVVRAGHAPNCSSAGAVVGAVLLSAVLGAAWLNAFAGRIASGLRRGPGDGPRGPADGDGGGGDAPDPGGPPTGRIGGASDAGGATPPVDGNREDRAFDGISADSPPEAPVAEPTRVRLDGATAHVMFPRDGAILAVDRRDGESLIAAGATAHGPVDPRQPGPFEVHLGVTARCPVRCTGCYTGAGPNPQVADPSLDELDREMGSLAALGAAEVAFGGGEAADRPDLLDLADSAIRHGLRPNLTTSGFAVATAPLHEWATRFAQVNVSMDGAGERYRAVRGWSGSTLALDAIRRLHQAGIRVGVNTVLTQGTWPQIDALGDAIREAGASEWFWLRWKPVGRGAALAPSMALDPRSAMELWPRLLDLEQRLGLRMRLDCALVPFLTAHGPPVDALERLGVRGCRGGEDLWSRSTDGRWGACSFAPGTATTELAADRWVSDPQLAQWRQWHAEPPEPCGSCAYYEVCRGGCRVVAAGAGDPWAPDPECPRVLSMAAEAA